MTPNSMEALQIDPAAAFANLWLAVALALVACLVYWRTHRAIAYTSVIYCTYIICCLSMTLLAMLAWNGMWIAVSMVIGMGLVRFHAWVRENRDHLYLLLTSAGIGVTCGCGEWLVAVLCTLIICAVLLALDYVQYSPGRHYQDYTLTFCVTSPEGAQAFVRTAPRLFSRVVLRSTGQNEAGAFEFVYGVRPCTDTVEDVVQVLRGEITGISQISLVRPEAYNVGVEV